MFNFVMHASNSVIGSVTVFVGLYVMLWGKDKEMQSEEKLGDEEMNKDQEMEFQVVKISVESEHPWI